MISNNFNNVIATALSNAQFFLLKKLDEKKQFSTENKLYFHNISRK